MFFLMVLSLTSLWSEGLGLVGYDCSQRGENTKFTIGDPSECSQITSSNHTTKPWEGTVLQLPLRTITKHRSCRLMMQRLSVYCSYRVIANYLYKSGDDYTMVSYPISYQECKKAWEEGTFSFKGKEFRVTSPGITKIDRSDLVNEEGFCDSWMDWTHSHRGHLELTWSDVVETTEINGNPPFRLLDDSKLEWGPDRAYSLTTDKTVVLSNNPPASKCG